MESPCEPAGLILLYPAFCIPDNWPRDRHKDFPETFEFMGMELSKVFLNGLPEVDVYEYIKSFDKPVLIFHGDADSLVDISYSEKLNKTYKNSTLVVCKNEGHGFSPEAREAEINRIIDYLRDILKNNQSY